MAPGSLTVLAPLRPGSEAGLRERLRAIGDDINGKRVTAAPVRTSRSFAASAFTSHDSPS